MSANWGIRSFGKPYFAMTQRAYDGMASGGLYGVGIIEFTVTFQMFARPTMSASASEIHPMVSIADVFGQSLFEVGITPLGALAGAAKNGATAATADGLMYPDGRWHTVDIFYDTGSGNLLLTLDSRILVSGSDGGGDLLPNSVGRMIAFNGPNGISRTDLAIRSIVSYSTDGTARTCTHLFNEKAGDTVAGTKNSGDFPDVYSFDLQAEFMTPIGHTLLWGPIPSSGLETAYRWQVDTDYEDVSPTRTVYEEVEFL